MNKQTKAINGIPVVDAKTSLKLSITPHDIKISSKKDSSNCAAAVACKRQLHAAEVRVHLSRTYIRKKTGPWVRYLTPRELRTEIVAFDRGGRFQPDSYSLAAPHKSNRLGVPRANGPGKKKGRKMLKPHHVLTNVRANAGAKS